MARPHKVHVDPGLGDTRAESGSPEWATGIRASLWGKDRNLGNGVSDVAWRLDSLFTTGGWKHLLKEDGVTPFASIEEFISYMPPYGMGVPLDKMRHYLGLTHEGKAIRAHLAVKGHPTHRVPLASIRRDGGTQVREGMSQATVDEYAAALADGAAFPPVVVFFDGADHWLADGFHRVRAHEAAEIPDVLAEVRQGGREDALWFALSANKRHGLPMSPEDKRRAVRLLLGVEKWRGMSNAAIAKELGISDHTVASVRQETGAPTSQSARLEGGDGKRRSAPGDAADLVRAHLVGLDPSQKASNAAIAKELRVSPSTVAKVRKQMAAAPAEDATDDKGPASEPAPPTRHPVLVEIDAARDTAALDRAFNRVALANLSATESTEASAAYQRRSKELRAQVATTTEAPGPVSPQATTAQPAQATGRHPALVAPDPPANGAMGRNGNTLYAVRSFLAFLEKKDASGQTFPAELVEDVHRAIERWMRP